MTSCALCRREQEINPKLLRARFDEQRMLNLAQRLAIPPPVRSRPSTSASSVSSREGIREEKEEQLRFGGTSPTLAREMLGQGGDVGAMSADDLRRRWRFSGLQAPTSSGVKTVGAASAAELRASWRALEHTARSSMYMPSGRDACTGVSSLSCSTNTNLCAIGSRSPVANLDSLCAGGNSTGDISRRWNSLPRFPLARTTSEHNSGSTHHSAETVSHGGSHRASAISSPASSEGALPFERSDVGEVGASHLQRRWHEAIEVGDVGGIEARDLSLRLPDALGGVEDIGGLNSRCLQERWHGGDNVSEVGKMNVPELSFWSTHGISNGGTGGLGASCLRKRWYEAVEAGDAGGMELRDLSSRLTHAHDGTEDIGGSDAHCVQERWQRRLHASDVGEMEIWELSIRLKHALGGGEDVGGMDTSCLRKRWHEAKLASDVGGMEVGDLFLKLTDALYDRSVGEIPAEQLGTRWNMVCEEQSICVGRSSDGLLCGEPDAHAAAARIAADSDLASKPCSQRGQAVGAVSPGTLLNRWCAAGQKSAPVS